MSKKEWVKKLKVLGLTDAEIKGGTSENIRYESSGCKIGSGQPTMHSLFDGLTKEDIEKLDEYILPYRFSDGTGFISYRDAVARLKFAKWLQEHIKREAEDDKGKEI